MAGSLLHQAMMGADRLNQQPAWLLLALVLLLCGLTWLLWRPIGGTAALTVALATLAGSGLDMAILLALPRLGISFGPWRGQVLPLALPRAAVALGLAPAALLLGPPTAVGLAVMAQIAGSLLLLRGAVVEPRRIVLTRLTLTVPHWPATAPPLQVLHISDLHVERLGRREAQAAALVARLAPDLVLHTGDYVNLSFQRDPQTLAQVGDLLPRLTGGCGSFGVLGTPLVDLYDTVPPLFPPGFAVRLLRNETASVDCGKGRTLAILGVDCSHHIPTDSARLDAALAGAPPGIPRVLLYHSPELMPQAVERQIDLYLCGHTHGGQVRLPLFGALITSSQLGRRYVLGLYQAGRTRLYVSRGVGLEGASAPRVRLLSRPEITLFTLVPAPLPLDNPQE